jgi:putative spermidine/putrescine transport system ATP-binding protein
VTVPAAGGLEGKRVIVSARPENLRLHAEPGPGRWPVQLRIRMPVGAQTVSEVVTSAGESLKVTEPRATVASGGEAGSTLYCAIVSTDPVSLFPAPAAAPAEP